MAIVKTIGRSGQISLGKEYAGRSVLIEELEPGTWLIKSDQFVPDSERWMYEPSTKADIDEAIAWAETTSPADCRLSKLRR